ncbi:S-adenosylmethionine decarboxylase proenzyme-like [Dendronephthya gigantea]|uniref:S-adenosylmethionine decarboxylase proenzyme-like n=1 Tax=Dendronephthya gigantea TaxID=151771 RepID=UPI00106BB6DD|nr:S-adenosylmethionine decarboxylase proenzyme-like [Dendronephthya gigantea]
MSGNLDFFEGSEKLLEIWWDSSSQLTGPTTMKDADLRCITRDKIEKILDLAGCKILSEIKNEYTTAYILSESSLFISSNRLILKTCGTTPLLRATIHLMKVVEEECGMAEVKNVFYSRKSFAQPHLQQSPHQNFQQEVDVLDEYFPGGGAYTLGQQNSGNCWHLFTIDNYTDGLQIPDQTLEILMNDLNPSILKHYYKGYYKDAAELTKSVGISDLIPGTTIDDVIFEPCGYSANGILKDSYFTIHVTPQMEFSYASFETNVKFRSLKDLIEKVLNIFKPGRFIMTLFGNTIAPCGNSLRTFEKSFPPYKRKDLHFARFKNYNLTYGHYEHC